MTAENQEVVRNGASVGKLAGLERLLGSFLLSHLCICLALIALDVSLLVYLLLLIPIANYTVKIDQLHRLAFGSQTTPEGNAP